MIKQFEKLSNEEQELLFKAPVLVSVLASCSLNEINRSQKADAIKLSHIKTFTAEPVLLPYYVELNKKFKVAFEDAQKKYFPFDEVKQGQLKIELGKVNAIVAKLDPEYGLALKKSFDRYGKHVKKAAHSIFQDVVFPLALPKFSD